MIKDRRITTSALCAISLALVAACSGGDTTAAMDTGMQPAAMSAPHATTEPTDPPEVPTDAEGAERKYRAFVAAGQAGLSDEQLAAIARRDEATVDVLDEAREVPRITREEAVDIAAHGFNFLLRGPEEVAASLARTTIRRSGVNVEEDRSRPVRIQPLIENYPVWLVVFQGAQVPIMGAAAARGREEDTEQTPPFYTANWLVYVDAQSGKIIRGVSF